jgi:hypothetical protein
MGEFRIFIESTWDTVNQYFRVRLPLFHATVGPKAALIIDQGLKSDQHSDFGKGQDSISLTESLDWALEGHRGNYIFVLDEKDISGLGKLTPYQHSTSENEYEKRFLGNHIPNTFLKGMIVNRRLPEFEIKELRNWVHFPVVYKHNGNWIKI